MAEQVVSGAKAPPFGGRKPLFTQKELLRLTGPLLVEQLLEVTVGMADTMMVSRCGEAAISGVSLVDMINQLIIVLFAALATGGAVVVSQFLGAREQKDADRSSGQLILLSGVFGVLVGAVCFFFARPMIRQCYGSDPPACAVITALGMDHVKELGPTIADIAAAKAGIIKEGCPVVSYGGVPEADAVIRRVCAEKHAALTEVDFNKLQYDGGNLDAVEFDFDGLNGVRLPLIGSYQPRNAALAITALRVMRAHGWNIPESAIRTGLETVSWPGRFELLRHQPAFLLDGSHNAHGMRATVQSLKDRFPGQKFVFLISIMADKDVDEMLSLLAPLAVRFVTVAAHTPRAMPAETLAQHIRHYGCTAEAAASIEAGVARAVELGGKGPVCALGTLYFSGDVRKAFAELVKG